MDDQISGLPLLPRLASSTLGRALRSSPVTVLMGARQTGKSTLAEHLPGAEKRQYLTLDDFDLLAQAREAPMAFLERGGRLTIDEVQRAPDLLLAIKRVVDRTRPRQPGQFLLTGSANLLLSHRVAESLAGRAAYVPLWPLTRQEQLGEGRAGYWGALLDTPISEWLDVLGANRRPREPWTAVAARGGYPVPAHELDDDAVRRDWFTGYTQTYLERDLRDLSAVTNLIDFRRVMRVAALRLGSLVNIADVARDAAVPPTTVRRYLDLLETSFQLVRLEPYAVNRTKRLIKSPKLYWSDTGLALHLGQVEHPSGAHFENVILSDLLAWRDGSNQRAQVMYWRTASGQEVDFVIERRKQLLPIEVKTTQRPGYGDVGSLVAFEREYGARVVGGLLIHNGQETTRITKGIIATPWWRVI